MLRETNWALCLWLSERYGGYLDVYAFKTVVAHKHLYRLPTELNVSTRTHDHLAQRSDICCAVS
jgi:hypothetical protein